MPTLPPGPDRAAGAEPGGRPRAAGAEPPHRARAAAESFGTDPDRYDRTRPRYPNALVDRIVAASPGREVLDVGIGTGISAQPFRDAGCSVLGVDPDERMAAFARARGFEVEVARLEDWEPAGRTFDAVIAGMTWHWVDPIAGAAKAAAVLRPGGRIAAFWYAGQPPPDLAAAFSAVYRRVLPGTPFASAPRDADTAYDRILEAASAGIRATNAFSDPEQWRVGWSATYTRDHWLEQVPTFGGHSTFPAKTLDALLRGIGAAIDDAGGAFTMVYTAIALTARRQA